MNLFRSKPAHAENLGPIARAHYEHLLREGFAHIPQGFPAGLIETVSAGVKRFLARNDSIFHPHIDADGHYPRLVNLHVAHEPLLQLFTQNVVALAVQDAFFEAASTLYTSLYYERGSAQSIHRDTPYFSTRPEYRYLGVWVALEDADERNGCLQIIRRGHLVPELERQSIALDHYPSLEAVPPSCDALWNAYQQQVMESCVAAGLEVELLKVKAGDVVIWHPQLPHGGAAIGDLSRTRHSLVMHVTPPGTPVYHHDVFFNPAKQVSERAKWAYRKFDGRKFVAGNSVDIGHKEQRPVSDFVR